MKHVNCEEVPEEDAGEGSKKTTIRWLITEKDGAKNFAMRLFEVQPGGYTPLHKHDWEHEIFILEGNGLARTEEVEETFGPGDVLFIPPNLEHQLKNDSQGVVRFLCLIPYKR